MHIQGKISILVWISVVFSLLVSLFICRPAWATPLYPEPVMKEIDRLYDLAGLDSRTEIVSSPYSEEVIDELLLALKSEIRAIRVNAQIILSELLRQWDIPEQVIQKKIVPAVSQVSGSELILWQIELLRLDEEQKLASLRESLKGGDLRNRKGKLTLYYLVEIGNEKAKEILRESAQKHERQGAKSSAQRRELGIKMIDIQKSLAGLDTLGKVSFLKKQINEHVNKSPGWGMSKFIIWLIRKLGEIDDPSATEELMKIWQDESLTEEIAKELEAESIYAADPGIDYRREAQEILIRLKKITPADRTITVDYI